jgi:hypothetical protein
VNPVVADTLREARAALGAPAAHAPQRFDFLAGKIKVPDDFDTMFQDEIENEFYRQE